MKENWRESKCPWSFSENWSNVITSSLHLVQKQSTPLLSYNISFFLFITLHACYLSSEVWWHRSIHHLREGQAKWESDDSRLVAPSKSGGQRQSPSGQDWFWHFISYFLKRLQSVLSGSSSPKQEAVAMRISRSEHACPQYRHASHQRVHIKRCWQVHLATRRAFKPYLPSHTHVQTECVSAQSAGLGLSDWVGVESSQGSWHLHVNRYQTHHAVVGHLSKHTPF